LVYVKEKEMIRLVKNELEGQWFTTTDRQDQPSPIEEMRIEVHPLKVWIRGTKTIWFRADQCIIGDYDDLKTEVDQAEYSRELQKLFLSRVCACFNPY
jgi:hypothetical protein